MNIKSFDGQCVRITNASGEVYEGDVSYFNKEYCFHEYGRDQEALLLVPILFYKEDIEDIESLENIQGPFGHYSERYGLLEKKCLEWGTDMMEEIFDTEDDIRILRMLACMRDHFQSLAGRAVRGMAPWRPDSSQRNAEKAEDEDSEQGPVYLDELEKMLRALAKHSESEDVVKEAESLLKCFAEYSS